MKKLNAFALTHLFMFITAIAVAVPVHDYPDAWWKPVPREDAQWWEVLPQDAKRKDNEVILSKRTELGIFSNFANTPITLDGKKYASIEGLWQMMKYPDPDDPNDPRYRKDLQWAYTRDEVVRLSGFKAKEAGDATKENYAKLGIQWVSYRGHRMEYKGKDKMAHYRLILRATRAKIAQNKQPKALLIRTGDLKLRPDHHQDADVPPAYRYFDILMKIRSEISHPR